MNKKALFSCLLCVVLSHVLQAQDLIPSTIKHSPGQMFRVIENPDGSSETVVIGRTDEQRLRFLEFQLSRGIGPVAHILDKMEPEDVSSLIADELTESQSADLHELLSEYRDLKSDLEADEIVAIRVQYGKKLSEMLIPEQINGTQLSGYIFHELCNEKGRLKNYLELSSQQQSDIESDCERINSEIVDLVNEIESKLEKLKEQAKKTLHDKLTTEQRKKLDRLVKRSLEDYFSNENLKSLLIHTELHPDIGPKY